MAIELNDNIHAKVNRPTDFRFGPFTSIAQANSTIPIAQRYHGLIFGVYTNPGNIATSNITFYYYWDGLTDTDIRQLEAKPPVNGSYANETAMIAAQATQTAKYIYYDNASYWEYLGTTNGNINDYRRISFNIVGPTTNGNVLTIVGGVPTWQAPVSTSKWTDVGVGNIYRNSSVTIGGTNDPTNTLDVVGTTRIRTINNLGTAATSVLVPSATGVVSLRTLSQFVSDAGLTQLSGLTTNKIIKATSSSTVGDSGITEESNISYLFGARSGGATATPLSLSLGGTFGNNTVGSEANSKLKLFDAGVGTSYGIGISGNLMEFSTPSGGFAFFPSRTRQVTILSGGNTGFGTATPSERIHVIGNVLIESTGSGLQYLSLGNSFGVGTPGSSSNLKIRLFDNLLGIVYGLGISSSLLEITSAADIGFFPANTRSMTVLSNGNLSFENGKNIQLGTTTGTKIGTATSQKIGFWNATPIVQPTGNILTALSNLGLVASPTISPSDITGLYQEQAFQIVSTSGTITDLVATSNRIVFTGTNPEIAGITGGVNGKTIQILFLGTGTLTFGTGGTGGNTFHPTGLNILVNGKSTEIVYYDNFWRANDGLGQALILNATNTLQNILSRVGINRTFIGGAGSLSIAPIFGSTRCVDIYDSVGTLNAYFDSTGQLFHARSTTSNQSVRRDELYLNYSQTVATAGTINDLAINASTKLLILTAATDLTGVIPVDDTRLLRIEARGASRIIRNESASSTAANRFSIGADLTINAGEVYQFIYTDSRWRRVL